MELGCFVKAKGRGPSRPEVAVGGPSMGRSAVVRCDLSGLPVGTWAKEKEGWGGKLNIGWVVAYCFSGWHPKSLG